MPIFQRILFKDIIKTEHGIVLLLSSFILVTTLIGQSWNDFALIADQTIQSIPAHTQLAQVSSPSSFFSFAYAQDQNSSGQLAQGLIGWWKFDEGSGTTAGDSSGNGNNGTLVNFPTNNSGWIGGALSFDGVDDYVNVPAVNSFSANAPMTISAWFKPATINTGGSVKCIVCIPNQTYDAAGIGYLNNNLSFAIGTETYDTGGVNGGSIVANKWYFITGTFNGTVQKLYLNGAYVNQSLSATLNAFSSLKIGGNGGGTRYFKGSLDDVRVYNRALSQDEITQLYALGSAQTPSDTTAPSVPTSFSATAISSSQINLFWTASTDNTVVTGYKIYRGGTQVGTSATNSYSDTGLTADTLYSYTISAYDAAGNISSQSSSASATTQPASVSIYTLTVSKSGTAAGTVSGGSINCGSTCVQSNITAGTSITLTAVPNSNSTFTGWSGGGCSGTGTCSVTVNSDSIITATFTQNQTQASGNKYITPNGAGLKDGSDWANAYAGLPASGTLQRGATYYFSAGTYVIPYTFYSLKHKFNDPNDGTKVITIKKATAAEHGTDVGWQTSYGGMSIWTASAGEGTHAMLWFITDYYVFDGGSRDQCILDANNTVEGQAGFIRTDGSHITISNCTITKYLESKVVLNGGSYNTFSHLYFINNYKSDIFYLWGSYNTISYNEVDGSTEPADPNPSSGNHADFVQTFDINTPGTIATDNLIEYNYVHDSPTRQLFMLSQMHSSSRFENWTFRNNIFANTAPGFSATVGINLYNNIFYNVGTLSHTYAAFIGLGSIAFNNAFLSGTAGLLYSGGANPNIDYNYFANITNNYAAPSYFNVSSIGTHNILGGTPDFVNEALQDFHLKPGSRIIDAGIAPAISFVDYDGVSRPQGSAWDIGAYEYYSGQSVTPPVSNPVNSLPITPVTPPTLIIGDFNNDGIVNSIDLSLMITAWNTSNTIYDLNRDGAVNSLDYVMMVRNWTV